MIQLQRIPHYLLYIFVWPYYGTLVRYTIEPLERIAAPQNDLIELGECVQDFARGKSAELKYIAFAATINAGLTVATFSWPHLEGAPWAAAGLLYASLFLTIGALITGSQHIMFFHKMCPYSTENVADEPCDSAKYNMYLVARAQYLDSLTRSWPVLFGLTAGEAMIPSEEKGAQDLLRQRGLNPSMILTWQCPIMLMAWSWVAYTISIVVLISKPFIAPANTDTDQRKVRTYSFPSSRCDLHQFSKTY
ncbi:hypothetical protein N7541_011422 [Penicillium brevicompactum]|uniref:Uncharacterized protein n=1 Tax=Penicillium brevicompactum TaxID=5074 RepID=A0A9W9QQL0_PENBR|nr:hypothetical protein N7541_011422 [Penicillium brevicompactum]